MHDFKKTLKHVDSLTPCKQHPLATCLSVPGVYLVLYADDILLIAPSVCGLDAIVKICELELSRLDMVINTRKSCPLRVGPRNNVSCLPVSLSAGTAIP